MSELEKNLVGFRRRVRWMRAWKGMAIGGTLGALVSLILSTLDYFRIAYASWLWLAVPVVVGIVAGAVVGFFLRLRVNDLADSIDRRATLENRLGTASEELDDEMRDLQRGDALAHLKTLKPAAVFPVRVTRWHGGLVTLSVLAASLFLLGNTPAFLSDKEKADRSEMKQTAASIERVIKPLLDRKPEDIAPEVKKIAKDFDELKREMEKGRIPKEEAMQKANKLAEKAEKVSKEEAQKSEMKLATAQEQLQKLAENEAMKELGLSEQEFDESRMEQAKEMSESDRKQMTEEMAKQLQQMMKELGMKSKNSNDSQQKSEEQNMSDLEQQLKDIEEQLKSGQDGNGKNLSKEQLEALKKLSEQMKELMKDLKMSKAMQDFMNKLNSMPEMAEIQKLLQKLAEAQKKAQQGDLDVPELTEQELAELKKALQEKMKELEDAIKKMTDADIKKMMEDYKKALEDAIKNGMQACQGGMCMMPGLMPGLPGMGMPKWGPSGPGQDNFFRDIGQVPLNEKGEDIKAGQMPISTSGQRQEKGEERYVEIRGPVKPGEKSKTPYFKVLPKYKKQAEDALDKNRNSP